MRDKLSATVELVSQDTGYLAAMEGWVVMGLELKTDSTLNDFTFWFFDSVYPKISRDKNRKFQNKKIQDLG